MLTFQAVCYSLPIIYVCMQIMACCLHHDGMLMCYADDTVTTVQLADYSVSVCGH